MVGHVADGNGCISVSNWNSGKNINFFLGKVVPEECACLGVCETLICLEKVYGHSQVFIPVIEIENKKHTTLTWDKECSLTCNFHLLYTYMCITS